MLDDPDIDDEISYPCGDVELHGRLTVPEGAFAVVIGAARERGRPERRTDRVAVTGLNTAGLATLVLDLLADGEATRARARPRRRPPHRAAPRRSRLVATTSRPAPASPVGLLGFGATAAAAFSVAGDPDGSVGAVVSVAVGGSTRTRRCSGASSPPRCCWSMPTTPRSIPGRRGRRLAGVHRLDLVESAAPMVDDPDTLDGVRVTIADWFVDCLGRAAARAAPARRTPVRLSRATGSEPGRVRLRRLLAREPLLGGLERVERVGAVEVHHDVELVGEARREVVALALGLRAVDDADRPLEPGSRERGTHGGVATCRARHADRAGLVEQRLVAVGQRRPDDACARPGRPSRSAAVTSPVKVVNPTSTHSSPYRWRASWPTLSSPRAPMPVARASPTWELCSHTTTLPAGGGGARGARAARRACWPCAGRAGSTTRPRRGTSAGSTPPRRARRRRSARRRTARPRTRPCRRGGGSSAVRRAQRRPAGRRPRPRTAARPGTRARSRSA